MNFFRRHGIIFANARVEDRYSFTVVGVVGSCGSSCAGATTATTSIARSGANWNYAGFSGWSRQFAPTPRGQSRAVPCPPLPRPRPAELTATPMEPMSEKLAPASVQSDQTQTPTEPAPAPDEPNEGPLNE